MFGSATPTLTIGGTELGRAQVLDQAFPEFAWKRDPRGWHASNREFTHSTLGVRAGRVICHGDAPRGFLIHGQGPVLWTTYVN